MSYPNQKPLIVVISMDGLGKPDIGIMARKTNFRRYLENAAWNQNVRTVYPSLTYPAHASIVTGKTPAHHGVTGNEFLQPWKSKPDWYWYRSYICGKPLYEAAAEKGYQTAAFLWPVTGCSGITYNFPEIFQNDLKTDQLTKSLQAGTGWFEKECIRHCASFLGKAAVHGFAEPYRDDFIHACAFYTFRQYRPGLTLIHYTDLDFMRHHYGHDSTQALDALSRLDARLGDWMDLLEKEAQASPVPIYLCVLGDHSSLDYKYKIDLNHFLQKCGEHGNGRVNGESFYAALNDGSCYLYAVDRRKEREKKSIRERLRRTIPGEVPESLAPIDPADVDAAAVQELACLLQNFSQANGECIEKIYSSAEAAAMGADPRCVLMLEARQGWAFEKNEKGKVLVHLSGSHATHGYSPEKPEYRTFFALNELTGKKQVSAGEKSIPVCLTDEGPTLAHLFGAELPGADGHVLTEYFS